MSAGLVPTLPAHSFYYKLARLSWEVSPPHGLGVLDHRERVQLLLGVNDLLQAYVAHPKRLSLDFVYGQHSWVMPFLLLKIAAIPLTTQLKLWRSHIITIDWEPS